MKVKLESFLQEVCEKTTENDQYPVLTSSKAGLFLQSEYFNKQVASKDNVGYKIIQRGQFTYRAMSDTGEFYPNMLDCVDVGIVSPAYPVFEIRDKAVVEPEYLKYFFKSKGFQQSISSFAQGSTRTSIKFAKLKTVFINLPSIDRQKDIVSILDKAQSIVDKENAEITKLDDLIKARFVEMFGDVKTNPNNYDKLPIKKVLKGCEAGWSGNGTQRDKSDDEIAVLKVSAVTKGYFIPEECKVLDDQENIKKYVTPEKGDLIFSRANTREMVGATAIINEDYPTLILPDKLWKIRFEDCVNVFYMKYVLSSKSIREEFSAASTGTSGSMYNVSMDKFKGIEVPIAPIELQNQFMDFVQQVDKSKVAVQKALEESQLLFDSLMQEYFG